MIRWKKNLINAKKPQSLGKTLLLNLKKTNENQNITIVSMCIFSSRSFKNFDHDECSTHKIVVQNKLLDFLENIYDMADGSYVRK